MIADHSTRGWGIEYPSPDSVGFQGQWGVYTDVETRPTGDPRALALIGRDSFFDPETGRYITRGSYGVNQYQAVLDVVGLAPGIGMVADAANSGLYLAQKSKLNPHVIKKENLPR